MLLFKEPLQEIEKMLSISKNILFSTNLIPTPVPGPKDWWYYDGPEHGQHISFYSLKTLQFLSKKYDLNIYALNNIYLLTTKRMNSLLLNTLCKHNYISLHLIKKQMNSLIFKDMKLLKISDFVKNGASDESSI